MPARFAHCCCIVFVFLASHVHGFVPPCSAPASSGLFAELKVAVVGGGWAGFSAATALSHMEGIQEVSLLDASPRGPGGLAGAGWKTKELNQTVEAGIHGFWREYRNTFAQMEEIGLDIEDVLTPFTPSLLVSSQGKVATAPVLGDSDRNGAPNANPILNQLADALPAPLDIALLADYDDDSKLSPLDRISALGLLGVWADFQQEDNESWKRYNAISAEHMFREIAGISPQLYAQLVVPLLHVLPMSTGYDCSAAAALSCFHVFALQSKGAFDVRWCQGSIAERIFDPWVQYLQQRGTVQIQGSARLTSLQKTERSTFSLGISGREETMEVDAVVLAIGATAAQRLLPLCPPLQNGWDGWNDIKRGITCVALRLILDAAKVSSQDIPLVTVCGPGLVEPVLGETGFCIYNLSRLQKEAFPDTNWVVVEVDYFRANPLVDLDDPEIVKLALASVQAALQPDRPLNDDSVLDFGIARARNAVSHFSVGASSPPVQIAKGLYMCGDWIDRSGHASWSTEKAVVTGKQAASALQEDFSLAFSERTAVIPATTDSVALQKLRSVATGWRAVVSPIPSSNRLFPRAPWTAGR